jgi:hypothetical protein
MTLRCSEETFPTSGEDCEVFEVIATNFSIPRTYLYHAPTVTSERKGPGLAKSKQARLVESRSFDWIRCTDYHWRDLFSKADVISEGAVRNDADGPTYYGATYIRFRFDSIEKTIKANERQQLAQMMRLDPHVRLRAMRLACIEARVRSNSEFSHVTTDIAVSEDEATVSICVDIEAKLISANRVTRSRASSFRGQR